MTLRCDSLSVRLGGRLILEDFSLEPRLGEFLAVVGANGAGKSTVLRALAGLIKPEHGGVTLDGAPLDSFEPAEIGRRIAYLPQDRTVHWALTSERVVALGRLPYRSFASAESDADRSAVSRAIARMDIAALKDRSIGALSGGEKARVLVARALAQEAEYLIADEPTAGLDLAHALALFKEFRRLADDGHAVVTAMHDLSLAARYATRVLIMKNGRCLAIGPPDSVFSISSLRQAFGVDAIVAKIENIPVVLPRSEIQN